MMYRSDDSSNRIIIFHPSKKIMFKKNITIILHSKQRLFLYLVLVLVGIGIWWISTDIKIMFGNYGYFHTYTDIILSIIIVLFFPVFIIAVGYKSWKY